MPANRVDGYARRREESSAHAGAAAVGGRRAQGTATIDAGPVGTLPPADIASMTRREYRAWLAAQEAAAEAASAAEVAAEATTAAPAADTLLQTLARAVPEPVVEPDVTQPVEVLEPVEPAQVLEPVETAQPVERAAVPLPTRRELRARQVELAAQRAADARKARVTAVTTHLPRVGIVGVLGLATVVAPMLSGGSLGGSPAGATVAAGAAPEGDTRTSAPTPSPSPEALLAASDFRVIPDDGADGDTLRVGTGSPLTAEQLAASREAAERASRDLARPVLPGCDGVVTDFDAPNGRMDMDDMCQLWVGGHYLRADAAVALAELNVAFTKQFGKPLAITDSYRSYRAQVSVRARKPGLAARPGTSQHGWGLAVDLAGGVQTADQHYRWLRENAPAFGWDNPAWARSGGRGPYEPWHWEYVAGQSADQR